MQTETLQTDQPSLILLADRFPKAQPKISELAWESGEGGNKDQGEKPVDKITQE